MGGGTDTLWDTLLRRIVSWPAPQQEDAHTATVRTAGDPHSSQSKALGGEEGVRQRLRGPCNPERLGYCCEWRIFCSHRPSGESGGGETEGLWPEL